MKFSIKTTNQQKLHGDCLVAGVFENKKLSDSEGIFGKPALEVIKKIFDSGDFEGKTGQSILLHKLPGCAFERVILVGLGDEKKFTEKEFASSLKKSFAQLKDTASKDVCVQLTNMIVSEHSTAWHIRQAVILAKESYYRFDEFKSKVSDKTNKPEHLTLLVSEEFKQKEAEKYLEQGLAIASGMTLAKDLGNRPGNICTPEYMAKQAEELAKEFNLDCEILDRKAMEKLGMGSLLSVTKGSHQPPKFIVLEYHGKTTKGKKGKGEKPHVLVGKGITFDTGGISLKPGPDMDQMKYDMSGAASVLGTMKAIAMMKLPVNVVALVPCVENMPGGGASRPGDIVKSMSGQTIEILNTDAEGRLILCDALTYAERFDPASVIDIATLTGACVIALGKVASGLFSNNELLSNSLFQIGQKSMDKVWPMPVWEDYQEMLKSPFADMANIGGRDAGSVTAACFLARFTKTYTWAHLDIAGTAWNGGANKGSTGRPVPLLTHYLLEKAGETL